MDVKQYIRDENRRKENISLHLMNLSNLLKDVVEEIEFLNEYMYVEDDDYYE